MSLWKNPAGFPLVLFFLIGGIVFWITIPDIFIGQIWVAVAVFVGGVFVFVSRRGAAQAKLKQTGIPGQAQILEIEQTGVYVNNQPQVKLKLRVSGQGLSPYEIEKRVTVPMVALGSLSTGRPLSVYIDREDQENIAIDWGTSMGAPATISNAGGTAVDLNANPQAREEVMGLLRQHGIDPTGEVDLRQNPAVRAAVLDALGKHGVDVAHGVAASAPSAVAPDGAKQPLDRLQKLMELKNAQLITDEEFAAQKDRVLKEI